MCGGLLALTLGACASPPILPEAQRAADRASKEALRLTTRQDWAAAQRAWQRAAQAHAALDAWPAYVGARIGEAQALAATGQPGPARALIEATLAEPFLTPELQAELEYERAWMSVELGEPSAARAAIRQSRAHAATPDLVAALDTLEARLMLNGGDPTAALALVQRVLRQAQLPLSERGNAHLIEGRALLALGQVQAARTALQAALKLHQTLARPAAIWATLQALAQAWAADPGVAAAYARRAELVCAAWSACTTRLH
jgi:tetratricopeptide (TPR) repeat protein